MDVYVNEIMKDTRKFEDKTKYQSAIGGLLYLSGSYRPDISTAVGQLASFCTDQGQGINSREYSGGFGNLKEFRE